MKSLYWRPQKVSRSFLLAVGTLAVLGLWLVESVPAPRSARTVALKWRAAERADQLMCAVREARLRRGLTIDPQFDPMRSGLIGEPMTLVTTRPGELRAKQTSCNPNFAAAIVELLDQAGVRPGDTVAIGWSGSFPAMNLAVCAAVETMELRPIVLASATSSQYGANHPRFFWLDMEHELRQRNLLSLRSSAVSLGGAADRGLGLSAEAIQCIEAAIARNGIPPLLSEKREQAVQQRMDLLTKLAGDREIKAYINVGGGVASTGGEAARHLYRAGLNRRLRHSAPEVDCVMTRFVHQGRPVIHLVEVRQLAETFGFPIAPTSRPAVGQGTPFRPSGHNRPLTVGVLGAILLSLRAGISTAWVYRIRLGLQQLTPTPGLRRRASATTVEPQLMV
jgi:poly-gamma-glutamate system protein